MRSKFLLLLFLLMTCCGTLYAQQNVTGTVKDIQGNPLDGASVQFKGSKSGTSTSNEGKFSLAFPQGVQKASLIITSVGMTRQELSVIPGQHVSVVLSAKAPNNLDNVVIVGVQSQTRRKTTSAISTVLAKDIQYLPSPSIDNLLQGRVAGLNVQITSGEPGTSPTLVVRGNGRLSQNIGDGNVALAHALSGPLYVIDGIPTNPEDISNSIDATGSDFLAGINIGDIESVDVQKDAAATAAWGSRGANGVVYIKTKRGTSKVPEFRVNVYSGITQIPTLLQTSTGAAEREQKMAIINQYATPAQLANLPQLLTDLYNPSFNNATNWQGLFYRTGTINNVDASMSAASENVNYRVSMNYYDEKGIIKSFGYKRYALRGNFNFTISPKLNSQFIIALSKSDRQRGAKFYGNSDQNTPVSGSQQPSSLYKVTGFDSGNFLGLAGKLRNKNIDDYYSASLIVNYQIAKPLRYSFQGGANITSSSRDYFSPSNIDQISFSQGNSVPSYAQSDKGTYNTYFISNSLNYSKSLETNKHVNNFALTVSQQFNADVSNNSSVGGSNGPSNNIQVVNGIPQADLFGSSDYASDGLLSFTGQLQYDLDNKYLLYGSYRGDASSRFGANTKWGYFPAAGIGWIVTEEKFMNNLKNVVSYLKVRGSYGVSGTQSDRFYAPYNSYNVPGTYDGGQVVQPSYTNGLTKNNLTWTNTAQKDIGVDMQLFGSRVSLTVDAYEKLDKNGYFNFALPFYVGYESIDFNARDLWINNKGIDVTLSTKNLSPRSKFQWNMDVTISHNTNLIAKLPNNNRTFVVDDGYGVSRIYAVGQPLYEMFQLKYMGVYNKESEIPFDPNTGQKITYYKGNHTVVPGDPIWLDVNKIGDVWPDENNGNQYGDRTTTGDPNPKFTGGWSNTFTYKNFSLNVLSIFTWKRTIINTFFQQQIYNISGGNPSNVSTFAQYRLPDLSGVNYWTPQKAKGDPNYKADFPSINPFDDSYFQNYPFTSLYNQDGSYFKVKTVSLSYMFPRKILDRLKLKGIRVYSIAENLLTIKNANLPNPEAVDQLGIYSGGLYPTPIRLTFGADIQF
ncbi:MAG: SusC/RagA family TonB-linked outer membrane protein [Ginsengibacter sp.]